MVLAVASGSGFNGPAEKTMPYRDAHSGWYFSQNLNAEANSYEYDDMTKLFKFVGINGYGAWLNSNIKISVDNIRASNNDATPYGTFDIAIRRADDSDLKPVVLERYSNCDLDPASPNYIATKIGDMKMVYDDTTTRYREYGNYPNVSKYVRVVVNPEVENGGANPALLPFGVFGPPRFKSWTYFSNSVGNSILRATADGQPSTTAYALGGGGIPMTSGAAGIAVTAVMAGAGLTPAHFGTASISYPSLATRLSASDDTADITTTAYFGVQTGKTATTTTFDPGYSDYVRPLGRDVIGDSTWGDTYGLGGYGSNLTPQFVFSLDEIHINKEASSFSNAQPSRALKAAYFLSGSYKNNNSWNSADSIGKGATRFQNILDSKVNRFTGPMYGGYDGLDIKERDPFRNTKIDDSVNPRENYAFYSIRRAIDTVADPEVIEYNLITIPGIYNATLTKHLIDTVETRADALAIIDIQHGFTPRHEALAADGVDASARKGEIDQAISTFKNRSLDSSYACTYYPWVRVRDDINNTFLYMPPSVAALGVLGSTEVSDDVWFAPAGFRRGGLSQGASGLQVVGVEQKLTSRERDDLYDVNINPIASFPSEGVVIFGQKTLQATRSALDRINVRRLMIFVKRGISQISSQTIFQPNVQTTWKGFKAKADAFLNDVKIRFGVDDFRVILDETTTTPDLVDRNIMYAKIFIKPTRAIEFIAIDFIITRSGASFED